MFLALTCSIILLITFKCKYSDVDNRTKHLFHLWYTLDYYVCVILIFCIIIAAFALFEITNIIFRNIGFELNQVCLYRKHDHFICPRDVDYKNEQCVMIDACQIKIIWRCSSWNRNHMLTILV